jgi:hypothetical protein
MTGKAQDWESALGQASHFPNVRLIFTSSPRTPGDEEKPWQFTTSAALGTPDAQHVFTQDHPDGFIGMAALYHADGKQRPVGPR